MTAVTSYWNRLLGPVAGSLLVGAAAAAGPGRRRDRGRWSSLAAAARRLPRRQPADLVRFVRRPRRLVIVITIPTAFLIIYMELKVIARMNLRVGPDRVGPVGRRSSRWSTGSRSSRRRTSPRPASTCPIFTLAPVVGLPGDAS